MKLRILIMSCMAALAWNSPTMAQDGSDGLRSFEIIQKVERIDPAMKTVTAGGVVYTFLPDADIRISGSEKPMAFTDLKQGMIGWRMGVGAYAKDGKDVVYRAFLAPPESSAAAKGTGK